MFQIRLFLPHVHNPSIVFDKPVISRAGYAGKRRRILVVDNEEVDREMLLNVLEPLGFVVWEAASGHECLELCPEFCPDMILMDLAMPGIDGWETIRRVRRLDIVQPKIAIVSANAFDKGLGNDCNVQTQDFILKPLNVAELIELIGRNLALKWLGEDAGEVSTPAPESALVYPPEDVINALNDLVAIGYVSGILKQLDVIEKLDQAFIPFVEIMRHRVRQFKLKEIAGLLQRAGVQ